MATQFLFPRPEYPRPNRQRGTCQGRDWLNLNGPWQFRFDGDRKGVEERWFDPAGIEWREQIIVPFCWESLAAWGEGDTAGNDNYYAKRVFRNPLEVTRENHRSAPRFEVGWYRRNVLIPNHPAWEEKRVILTIGASDFYTQAWCNGKSLGQHEGGYLPIEFDLTDALEPGPEGHRTAHLVLRVEDPMENSEQPVGKQWKWYTTVSGIWQTVFIEPRHATSIRAFRFSSDIAKGTVLVRIECANADNNCSVHLAITAPDQQNQEASLPVQSGIATQEIELNSLQLWDPNRPELYTAVLTLNCRGKVFDSVRTYFGMRKIDFELDPKSEVPTAIRLNGVPRYLRGALHQSYYPDGVYTPSNMETFKQDILAAKRFGFNFLRIHIKIDDPLLLYWADQLGILLMADFPNFGEGGDTPLGRSRFEAMMIKAIERDYNHPSIIAWCLFNETWGFGGQVEFVEHLKTIPTGAPVAGVSAATAATAEPKKKTKLAARGLKEGMLPPQDWVQDMWELAKRLDSTRLVEDMSVCHWEHLDYYLHCDTDINSWHFYSSDYAKAKEHIDRVANATFLGSSFNYVPGFQHKGQPLINSEYGGVGALDGDKDVSWSFKFLTNELRRHQQIAAYIYTELHDVEWEYNGFLNYDRTPKEFGYDPRIINESNTLPIDSPPVVRAAPGETVRLEVASSHYSSTRHENVELIWFMGGMDDRGIYHQALANGSAPIAFPHRRVARAHRIEVIMPRCNMLCTLFVEARDPLGRLLASNFVHYYVSGQYPIKREESPRMLMLRGYPGDWTVAEWSEGHIDRDRAMAEDNCYGFGTGFFEWTWPDEDIDLTRARRIIVLCEASSHRSDSPQTDQDALPTMLEMTLNGVPLYHGQLCNHPHDARGVLSYMRGGFGAYGYLAHGFAETPDLIQKIHAGYAENQLRLRCAVPPDAPAQAGLTIYGAECGRFPVTPTVVVEW